MSFRATYKQLRVRPLWIGCLTLNTLTIQANILGYKGAWLEYSRLGKDSWEVIITDGDDEYITTSYCSTKELLDTIMYVQVNKEYPQLDGNIVYEGEVYTLDTNQKICDFEWELDWGVVNIEPKVFDGSLTDFIDAKCCEIWDGSKEESDDEEEVY